MTQVSPRGKLQQRFFIRSERVSLIIFAIVRQLESLLFHPAKTPQTRALWPLQKLWRPDLVPRQNSDHSMLKYPKKTCWGYPESRATYFGRTSIVTNLKLTTPPSIKYNVPGCFETQTPIAKDTQCAIVLDLTWFCKIDGTISKKYREQSDPEFTGMEPLVLGPSKSCVSGGRLASDFQG